MKYTVKVTGEAALGLPEQDFEVEAATGDDAANIVRDDLHKLSSKEGGDLDIVVSATEEWGKESRTPLGGTLRETVPPGVVSIFSIHVQPHESVRLQVAAKRMDAELAKLEGAERAHERARLLSSLMFNGTLTAEQFRVALTQTEKTLESIVDEAVTGKVVSQ